MRGRCCCIVCMAVCARVIAWLVNSLLVKAKKSNDIHFRCQSDQSNPYLDSFFPKFWGDDMIAVCT